MTAPTDPATRVLDDLGREWAMKTNGSWAVLGEFASVDSFDELAAKYGVMEVLG